jgi:hypothetical protein
MQAVVLAFIFSLALSLSVLTPSLGLHEVHAAIPFAAAAVAANIEPIFVSIAVASEILATSRSEVYQRIARGELDAVKDGARTKVTYASVKRVAAALPKADVKLYVRQAQRTAAPVQKQP